MTDVTDTFTASDTMPPGIATIRGDLLDHAKHLTCIERNAFYGDPLLNFTLVAQMRALFWSSCQLPQHTPVGHAIDMILLNLARIATAPTQEAALAKDRYADLCGYAALAFEVGTRSAP